MEKLTDIRKLHQQVQHDIFRILLEYKVLSTVSCTVPSKTSLYFFTEEHRFLLYEMPVEIASYINSVNRLLETGYLYTVTNKEHDFVYLIKSEEYLALTKEEADYLVQAHDKSILDVIQKTRKFSFLDEIL